MVMNEDRNLPPEDRPVYDYGSKTYIGEAVGGPRHGEILSATSLTQFVVKPYRPAPTHYYMSGEEQIQMEKDWNEELARNKKYPDRYDYDIGLKKWVFVEYRYPED